MENFGYKKLITWQLADKLAKEVYIVTLHFPKHELYGIISQIRRAALSVVLNIIEGHSRNNRNEFRQFLRIALGSLTEVEYLLEFSREQKYITEGEYQKVIQIREECGKLLWKLLQSQS